MIQKIKISVIVPVYGVEMYIEKCLKSIQRQTFKDFECIVVDDGSPDNSIAIGKEAIGDDSRFKFIEKTNGGLASARNFGLNQAKGEYIAFVDSDDWVEPDFLKEPYKKIIHSDADICLFSIKYVDENGSVLEIKHNLLEKYYTEKDFLIADRTVTQFSCSKLFKNEVLIEIPFNEDIITYEDVYVNFRWLYGRKVVNVEKALYNYLQREGSLSKHIAPSYLQDRVAITLAQKKFVKEHKLDEKYPNYILYAYLKTFVFNCSIKFARYSNNYTKDIKKFKQEIDFSKFTYKNIWSMIKKDKRVGISLLIFKTSPLVFRGFTRFYFRSHVA